MLFSLCVCVWRATCTPEALHFTFHLFDGWIDDITIVKRKWQNIWKSNDGRHPMAFPFHWMNVLWCCVCGCGWLGECICILAFPFVFYVLRDRNGIESRRMCGSRTNTEQIVEKPFCSVWLSFISFIYSTCSCFTRASVVHSLSGWSMNFSCSHLSARTPATRSYDNLIHILRDAGKMQSRILRSGARSDTTTHRHKYTVQMTIQHSARIWYNVNNGIVIYSMRNGEMNICHFILMFYY